MGWHTIQRGRDPDCSFRDLGKFDASENEPILLSDRLNVNISDDR